MYLYDTINNTVHTAEAITSNCGITQRDKGHCFLVDSLDNVDEQGINNFAKIPKRCPFCMTSQNQ